MNFVSGQKSLRFGGEHVAAARADLMSKLTILSRALWGMNWDVYLDDEDTPNDEQSATLRAEAAEAEANLEVTIGAALRSVGALQSAILDDIGLARTTLHALSENLVSRGE